MIIYNSYDDSASKIDFDFYSTDPAVFCIICGPHEGRAGIFADAFFRSGHGGDPVLYSVSVWTDTGDEHAALAMLIDHLRDNYTTDDPEIRAKVIRTRST